MRSVKPRQVENHLLDMIRKKGPIHFTLIDPDKTGHKSAADISSAAEKAGTNGILVGGSTIVSSHQVDLLVKSIKKAVHVPVILFPGNVSGVSRFADAILFMSLLNSSNPYFIIDAPALAASLIKTYGVEPIPLGYIIMGPGGTAGFVGYARTIPYRKPSIATAYALAAQYLGMRFVYLDAGSGAEDPIPPNVISMVKKEVGISLIVGGGIRGGDDAGRASKAGADVIVTGTLIEESESVGKKIREIVGSMKKNRSVSTR